MEVKWIKLSLDLFEDGKIKLLRAKPKVGDAFVVIWIYLLVQAGKCNDDGCIYINRSVPLSIEELSILCGRKKEIVKGAIDSFENLGMIHFLEGGHLAITNWAKHQNLRGLDRIRESNRLSQQKCRARRKPTLPRLTSGDCHLTNGDKPVGVREVSGVPSQENKKEEEDKEPPTVPQGGQAIEPDLISDPTEAKRLICELILKGKNPDRPWSYAAQSGLSRLLPMPTREIKLLAWFHGLRADDDEHELKVRPQSETTLIEHWSDEVTRAAAFRKKTGAGRSSNVAKKDPALWKEFFVCRYGGGIRLPESFAMLGVDQVQVWKDEHDAFDQSPQWWQLFAVKLYGERDDYPASILQLTSNAREEVLKEFWKNAAELSAPKR